MAAAAVATDAAVAGGGRPIAANSLPVSIEGFISPPRMKPINMVESMEEFLNGENVRSIVDRDTLLSFNLHGGIPQGRNYADDVSAIMSTSMFRGQSYGSGEASNRFDVGRGEYCHYTFFPVIFKRQLMNGSAPLPSVVTYCVCYSSFSLSEGITGFTTHYKDYPTQQGKHYKLEGTLIGDKNAWWSIIAAINCSNIANGGHITIFPWLGPSPDLEQQLTNAGIGGVDFRLHGASMGHAVVAAITGMPSILYTGSIKSISPNHMLAANNSSRWGGESATIVEVGKTMNILENVDFLGLKFDYAAKFHFPLVGPYNTALGQPVQQAVQVQTQLEHQMRNTPDANYLLAVRSNIFSCADIQNAKPYWQHKTPILVANDINDSAALAPMALCMYFLTSTADIQQDIGAYYNQARSKLYQELTGRLTAQDEDRAKYAQSSHAKRERIIALLQAEDPDWETLPYKVKAVKISRAIAQDNANTLMADRARIIAKQEEDSTKKINERLDSRYGRFERYAKEGIRPATRSSKRAKALPVITSHKRPAPKSSYSGNKKTIPGARRTILSSVGIQRAAASADKIARGAKLAAASKAKWDEKRKQGFKSKKELKAEERAASKASGTSSRGQSRGSTGVARSSVASTRATSQGAASSRASSAARSVSAPARRATTPARVSFAAPVQRSVLAKAGTRLIGMDPGRGAASYKGMDAERSTTGAGKAGHSLLASTAARKSENDAQRELRRNDAMAKRRDEFDFEAPGQMQREVAFRAEPNYATGDDAMDQIFGPGPDASAAGPFGLSHY